MFYIPLGMYLGVELLSHRIAVYNFLRNCQTVFRSVCTILNSHQQRTRVPVFHTGRQHLLLFVRLSLAALLGVRRVIRVPDDQ